MLNFKLKRNATLFCCIILIIQFKLNDTDSQVFKCKPFEYGESLFTQEGKLFFNKFSLFRNCTGLEEDIPAASGWCLFCTKISILACYGSNVTKLPNSNDLPANLSRFQVSNSDVRFIPQAAFSHATITEIYIENNDLYFLHSRAFEKVNGVEVLSLASNTNLPHILVRTFFDLTELKTLILDDNNLELTYSGDYVKVGSNKNMNMMANPLQMPKSKLVLETLSLQNNPLRSLSKSSFLWLSKSRLTYLNMRSCSIESAHQGKYKHIKHRTFLMIYI